MTKLYKGIIDLHNHTLFSDGDHSTEELIQNAISSRIDVIGISDHYEKINDYKQYYEVLNELTYRYRDELKILKGIEIKTTTFLNLTSNDVLNLNQLDYILIEDCEYYKSIYNFISKSQQILPQFNMRIGMAHVDLQKIAQRFGLKGLSSFFGFLEDSNIFWEINSNFHNEFYDFLLYNRSVEIQEIINMIENYNIDISVGSDTHDLNMEFYPRLLKANQLADVIGNVH